MTAARNHLVLAVVSEPSDLNCAAEIMRATFAATLGTNSPYRTASCGWKGV